MNTRCRRIEIAMLAAAGVMLGAGPGAMGKVTVGDLRCEHLVDPEGISEVLPRLSWVLESPRRGERQTACQVLVASSREKLDRDTGDLWDSGKMDSDQSVLVRYRGSALKSGQACHWKVRVWDRDGKPTAWSPAARWSMGLLNPGDWRGQWIGKDEEQKRAVVTGTQWIWYPESPEPPARRWFRRVVELPAGRVIRSAKLFVAADNLSVVTVNGEILGRANNFKAVTPFDAAHALKAGRNVIAISVENIGDGPNPAGLLVVLRVECEGAEPLVIATDGAWKTAKDEQAGWDREGFDDSGWVAPKVVGPAGCAPWGEIAAPEDRRLPARWLRREFAAEKPVRRATVYYSGLGLSELYVNGRRVGDEVLSPGLTEYGKRVFYVTHDVTALLRRGSNALGVVLGNGRYYAPRTTSPMTTTTHGFPKLLLHLRLEYADGTTEDIVSDASWKLTTAGPIRANNEYDGEDYDARRELEGWAKPGFVDAGWERVQGVAAPGGELVASMTPPIRVTGVVRPVAVKSPQSGVHIFDMGQNMVGWCRIKVRGPAGTEITLRHAETLKPDGTLYLDNIRGAKVTDRYVLKGGVEEAWEPRFTYHGFRFVEVRGWPGTPKLSALEGRVVNDDLESAGSWACASPLLNRIYSNILWGVRGNYRSIPTDCPQRDERQGWLGDRSAECRGESYLFRNTPLYAKWACDIADAQKESGSVPDVAPAYWPIYSDNVTWPSSLVFVPGMVRDQAGDAAPIARAYPAMVRWMDYMSSFLTNGVMPRDQYGDWCVPPEDPALIHSKDPARKTAGAVLGTAYFHHCARRVAQYAEALGKKEDAERFGRLAAALKAAFNRAFFRPADGFYDNGTQTACVLPLAFDLAPAEQRDRVFARLTDKITRECGGHIGTGLIGGQWLMRTLTDHGRADLAYAIATQKTYPSWGYMIEQGATTIWELWNGNTADPAMNSHNHVMLVGDLTTWMHEDLAGIRPDPDQPGFRRILMRPQPVEGLAWVSATHRSPYGLVASAWRREGGAFRWDLEVPANATAEVAVPADNPELVREGSRSASSAEGVRFLRREAGRAVYEVGSGRYRFTAPSVGAP